MAGGVKATVYRVNQEVEARVELERTVLGDVIIHVSGIRMGNIVMGRSESAGYSCLIQGWLRKRILSGFYQIWDPGGKGYDWGRFHAEVLESPGGLGRA
jgi:hypothetical protein